MENNKQSSNDGSGSSSRSNQVRRSSGYRTGGGTRHGSNQKTTTGNSTGGRFARGGSTSRGGAKSGATKTKRFSREAAKRRSSKAPALQHRLSVTDTRSPKLPEITDEDTVRIIPISGVEEIGRNMIVLETKDDMVVFDIGLQFVSEASNAPGINYILPNTQYVEERKHKLRALVVTHGHLDHIGGIPFVMERIGNPPVYTQYLTSLMMLKRQEEFPQLDMLDMHVVKEGDSFTVGKLKIKTFPVTHSIPDAMGISVETKHGDVVITGDVKLTHTDGVVDEDEAQDWLNVGKNKNIALLCDSTNAWQPGFSAPESNVLVNLDKIVRDTNGRLIIGTFASNFERLFALIRSCEKYGKKVVLEGRSIKTAIDIAITAKLLTMDPKTIIPANDISDYPADKIVILSTGAQGEEFAALMRMSTDKHKFITLNERDTIVLSSSVIPGNEIAVQILRDNIYRKNAKVVTVKSSAVHSTGHGNAGELVWIHQATKPKFLIPVHGHHFMLKSHMFVAIENGFPRDNIVVPDNGFLIDIKNGDEIKVHKEKAPTESVMVDGFTVGTRQEVVLRDRQSLSEDGMFVIIATVNTKTGKLRKSPDIISRGFVYLRENQQLLSEARTLIKQTVEKHTSNMHPLDLDYVRDELTNTLSGFLMQKTNKTPMVIPVLIGI